MPDESPPDGSPPDESLAPAVIRVVRPGPHTTIQDEGRAGHQHEGVPVGGAMDALALRVANLLVGNDPGDAVLELTLAGAVLRFDRPALVALAGADMPLSVDGTPLPSWRTIALPAGATLEIGAAASGARCCLAVAGGIDVPRVLGSRSMHQRAGLGGVGGSDGRALRAGDLLPVGTPSALGARIMRSLAGGDSPAVARAAAWGAGREIRPAYSGAPIVRLVEGTHQRLLTGDARSALFGDAFRVSPRSDRMGYRLDGPALALGAPLELRSEAVAFGTVQLPPGGAPIVLMADRQATGGYPRIGEVATVDLPLLAQLRPGDVLRFRAVSLDDARRLYVERERDLSLLAQGVRHRVG